MENSKTVIQEDGVASGNLANNHVSFQQMKEEVRPSVSKKSAQSTAALTCPRSETSNRSIKKLLRTGAPQAGRRRGRRGGSRRRRRRGMALLRRSIRRGITLMHDMHRMMKCIVRQQEILEEYLNEPPHNNHEHNDMVTDE